MHIQHTPALVKACQVARMGRMNSQQGRTA